MAVGSSGLKKHTINTPAVYIPFVSLCKQIKCLFQRPNSKGHVFLQGGLGGLGRTTSSCPSIHLTHQQQCRGCCGACVLCFASHSGRKVTAGAPGKPGGPENLLCTGVKEPRLTLMPKSVPTPSLYLSRESQVQTCFYKEPLSIHHLAVFS